MKAKRPYRDPDGKPFEPVKVPKKKPLSTRAKASLALLAFLAAGDALAYAVDGWHALSFFLVMETACPILFGAILCLAIVIDGNAPWDKK